MARMVMLVPLVRTALSVFEVSVVSLVLLESAVPPVLPAQLVPSASVERVARKAQSELLDPLVLAEMLALKVPLAMLGLSGPVDLPVCQERMARMALMVSKVSLALVETMVHRVCVVSLALLVLRA